MRFILLMLLCVFTLNVFGQGIDFFKGNLSEALTKARSENKIVFVDFVASGSEPCEQMSAEVFSQEIISAYFNQRFICVQIDVEKEKELTQKYDVTRVPSMLFFSPEGKIVKQIVGPISLTDLVQTAMFVAGDLLSLEDQWVAMQGDKKNLDLQLRFLLQAPELMATIRNQKELEKWQFRVEKVIKHYLAQKPRENMINREDANLIMMYCSQPQKKNEPVEFMIQHLEEFQRILPVYTLVSFFASYQDRLVQSMAMDGDLEYKQQIARIKGDLKSVFDSVKTKSFSVEYLMTAKADAFYALYAQKDQAKYVRLQKEFFDKMGDLASPSDYQRAVVALMDAVANKLTEESATAALSWLDKLLSGNSDMATRVRYLIMAGDCYQVLENNEKAKSCYNEAYMLSFQTGDINLQVRLREKMDLLS